MYYAQLSALYARHETLFIVGIIFLVIVLPLLFIALFIVDQQTVAVVERLGKFNRASQAGIHIKIPFFEWVVGRLSLRIRQLDIPVETKTKDNVFVKVNVSVQYQVIEDKIFEAYYKLSDPSNQIQSYIFDVVRAQVPKMELDHVFENKDLIANAVKDELSEVMATFGYSVIKALVTDIDPDVKVKAAMNEINEQKRLRVAAQEKGEAEKILKVKQAEGDAESMRLAGEGVANQRKAIIQGLKESLTGLKQSMPGLNEKDILELVLMTQYFDTLKEIGSHNNSNTILLPQARDMNNFSDQMREGFIAAQLAAKGGDSVSV